MNKQKAVRLKELLDEIENIKSCTVELVNKAVARICASHDLDIMDTLLLNEHGFAIAKYSLKDKSFLPDMTATDFFRLHEMIAEETGRIVENDESLQMMHERGSRIKEEIEEIVDETLEGIQNLHSFSIKQCIQKYGSFFAFYQTKILNAMMKELGCNLFTVGESKATLNECMNIFENRKEH